MLYEAAYWRDGGEETRPEIETMMAQPQYAHYVEGWGRPGDRCVVALDGHDQPAGAAWYRSTLPDEDTARLQAFGVSPREGPGPAKHGRAR